MGWTTARSTSTCKACRRVTHLFGGGLLDDIQGCLGSQSNKVATVVLTRFKCSGAVWHEIVDGIPSTKIPITAKPILPEAIDAG